MKTTIQALCSWTLSLCLCAVGWAQAPGLMTGYAPSASFGPGYSAMGYGYLEMPPTQMQSPYGSPQIMPAGFHTPVCDDCGEVCDGSCGGGGLLEDLGLGTKGLCLGNGAWFRADYLLWWSKERFIPLLATTSDPGTPEAQAGIIGQPTTSSLYGGGLIGGDPSSGFRLDGGTWLNQDQSRGIGTRGWYINSEKDFAAESDINGSPILARPFFNTQTNAQDALLVAYPGISHGNIDITAENEAYGFDIFFRKLLLSGYCNRFDFVGGYHMSTINDTVAIRNSLISDDPARIPLGAQIDTADIFEVENEFHGGFVGLMAEAADGRLSWNLLAKVAFGNMNQDVTISGQTTTTVPGVGSSTDNFGLLALPTNIGSYDRDEFAIVPELNVGVACNVTNCFAINLGYSLIYWDEIALAGDLIDTTINPSQIGGPLVGPARPSATLISDSFWYSGASLGATFRW